MSSRTVSSPDARRALLHEQLDALLDDCERVMNNAAYGEVLDDLDDFLFVEGKKFIRKVLQEKLQERIEQDEAKEELKQCDDCKKKRTTDTNALKPSSPLTTTLPLNAPIATAHTANISLFLST